MSTITTNDVALIDNKKRGYRAARGLEPWLHALRGFLGRPEVFPRPTGCRCIAHDRRGHGRSNQFGGSTDLDTGGDGVTARRTGHRSPAYFARRFCAERSSRCRASKGLLAATSGWGFDLTLEP